MVPVNSSVDLKLNPTFPPFSSRSFITYLLASEAGRSNRLLRLDLRVVANMTRGIYFECLSFRNHHLLKSVPPPPKQGCAVVICYFFNVFPSDHPHRTKAFCIIYYIPLITTWCPSYFVQIYIVLIMKIANKIMDTRTWIIKIWTLARKHLIQFFIISLILEK